MGGLEVQPFSCRLRVSWKDWMLHRKGRHPPEDSSRHRLISDGVFCCKSSWQQSWKPEMPAVALFFYFVLFGGGGGCIVECAMKQAHSAYLNGEEIMKCSCYTVDFQQTLITTFCTSLPWRRLRLDWRGVIVWNIYLSSIIHAGICQKKKKKTSDFAKL